MCHDPGALLLKTGIEVAEHRHPGFDITPLRPPYLALGGRGQVGQVPVLNSDQVRFVEREVEVELDQPHQRGGRVRCGVDDALPPGHEPGADPDQQFDQQGLFVGEVAVDGRSADAGRGTDVFESNRQEAAFGDQLLCGRQQL